LITRDTVDGETAARSATSAIVTERPRRRCPRAIGRR
jgi:hypothetical protein